MIIATHSRIALLSLLGVVGCGSIFDGHTPSIVMDRVWLARFATPSAWPGVAAVDGGLVIVGLQGGMAAFDARTGSARWRATIWSGGEASFSGNVVTNNGVACIADYFGVGCVDMATGQVRWTRQDDRPTQDAQSAIDATGLYYGTYNHSVVARDLATGQTRWATDIDSGTILSSRVFGAAVRGDTVFATTVRWLDPGGRAIVGDLIALSRITGQQLWRYTAPSPSGFQGAPVLDGNLAILNDVYSHGLVAIDLTTRKEAWHTPVQPDGYITAETPPVLIGNTIFSGSTDTQVYALDAETGAYHWRVGTQAGSIGNTAVCGRLVLVVPFSGGPLSAVDRVRLRADRPAVLQGDEVAGGIAVSGTTAYAIGSRGLYALGCPE